MCATDSILFTSDKDADLIIIDTKDSWSISGDAFWSTYNQKWDFVDSQGKAGSLNSTSVDYNDPEDMPYLHITFSGSK